MTPERSPLRLSLIPPALAILVFGIAIGGDFAFDDVGLIEKSDELRSFDLERIFASNYWGDTRFDLNYRPTVLLSYAINFQLGDSPAVFLAVNVLLNACVAWALFWLIRALFRDDVKACLGASLFGVLAIHSEAIAGVVGRAELLSALGAIVIWTIATRERVSNGLAITAGLTLFLALGSKESALVVLPLMFASAWALRRPMPWKVAIASGVGAAIYLIIRQVIIADYSELLAEGKATLVTQIDNPLYSTFCDPFTRIVNGIALLGDYALKIVAPLTLSVDYSYNSVPVEPLSSVTLWLRFLAVLVAIVGGTFWARRSGRDQLALAILVFPLAFSITANVVLPIGTIFGERLAYLPSLALPLLLLTLVPKRGLLLTVGVALIALNGTRSIVRCLDWKDRDALYAQTVETSPNSTRAWVLRAGTHSRQALTTESAAEKRQQIFLAERALERAIQIYPQNILALGSLANHYALRAREGMLERSDSQIVLFVEADNLLDRAFAVYERNRQHLPISRWNERGRVRLEIADVYEREARKYEDQLAEKTPDAAQLAMEKIRIVRAKAVEKRQGAIQDFSYVIERDGAGSDEQLAVAHGFRGLVYGQGSSRTRDAEKIAELLALARKDFDRSLQLNPEDPNVWNNSGILKSLSKDVEGAIGDFRQGLEVCSRAGMQWAPNAGVSMWSFLQRIAQAQRLAGRADEAAESEAKAAAIKEKFAPKAKP